MKTTDPLDSEHIFKPDVPTGGTAQTEKASLSKRFAASFIDGVILSIVGILITAAGGLLQSKAWVMLWTVVSFLIPFLYVVWPYSTSGQTLGKQLRNIRVVSIDGSPLNWRRGVLRWIGYLVSALPLGLGYLWALWDRDGQAWHDKLAGTIVVDEWGPLTQPLLSKEEARRRRRRWQVALGLPSIIVLFVVALFSVSMIQRGVAEVRAMQPWPRPLSNPQDLAPPDLSHLGLDGPMFGDARADNSFWREGIYDRGIVAEYASAGRPAVVIAFLRYEDNASASQEFGDLVNWASENCGRHTWVNLVGSGLIQCTFTDAFNKIFLNENWIIDLLVMNSAAVSPQQFIDDVRDAMVAHWATLQ